MKSLVRQFLRERNLYYPLRYSRVFNRYSGLFKPDLQLSHKRELSFYGSFLSDCSLIFDIGGYDGHKTAAFLHFSHKVICCEPEPENFRLLGWRFRNNKNVVLLNAAISDKPGNISLFVHHPGSAFNTVNSKWKQFLEQKGVDRFHEDFHFAEQAEEVKAITLDEMINTYGMPQFIKIDVEGNELNVLKGLNTRVPCLSIEMNLPEFKEEGLECLRILEKLNPAITIIFPLTNHWN